MEDKKHAEAPRVNFDEYDERIVRELQTNARLTVVELAQRVGLSQTPVRKRLQALESSGAIEGYSVRVNRKAFGVGVFVFAEVALKLQLRESAATLQQVLTALPQVTSLHVISGDSDLLLEIHAKDLEDYESFVAQRLLMNPNVARVRSLFVMKTLKEHDVRKHD